MNREQAQLFQQLLEEACDHYINDGGKIIEGIFQSINDNAMCPIACLVGSQDWIHATQELVREVLDYHMSKDEVWALIHAFDGNGNFWYYEKQYVSAMLIGKALREKYIKE